MTKIDLFGELQNRGLLKYGQVILGDLVRSILEIEYPETGTKKQFDEVALQELAAVDYVRNKLLGQGMYLTGVNGDYRILLPSENKKQIEAYMSSAERKLSRANKLSRNTPKSADHKHDNTEVRIMMKRQAIKESRHA